VLGRFSYANVMSTIAVFLALGGGGFAVAAALKKNSVGPKQVKNESLKSKDLKNNAAVKTSDVVDQTLGGEDIGPGAVGTSELASGEARHVVGGSGEPGFGAGGDADCLWSSGKSLNPAFAPVSFYKDVTGRVYIEGVALATDGVGGDTTCDVSGLQVEQLEDYRAFTLPPGYRPDEVQSFSAIGGADPAFITIGSNEDTAYPGGATLPAGAVIAALPSGGPVLGITLTSNFRVAEAEPVTASAPGKPAPAKAHGPLGLLGR
jgi:hypothetical protein